MKPQADAVDRRVVVRIYAAVLCAAGLLMAGWGPLWLGTDLPGLPFGKAAVIRMLSSVMILTGCFGAALGEVREPPALKRGLFWFVGAHAVAFGIVMVQLDAVWAQNDLIRSVKVLIGLFFLFCWLILTSDGMYNARPWKPLTLFGGEGEKELKSLYEEQIRLAAAQEERHRLARELHDSIKQQIFVVQTAAATAQARFDSDEDGTRAALAEVRGAAREAMTEMEAMLDQLRAAPLEVSGLAGALKQQCEALAIRTGATVDFLPGKLPANEDLPPGSAQAVYRVAQEALANAGRHARAKRVEVRLEQAGRNFQLRVADDGAGFDPNSAPRGMGLANMQVRAGEQGGSVELTSTPGRGTVVELRIPLADSGEDMMMWHFKMSVVWAVMALFMLALLTVKSESQSAGRLALLGVASVGCLRSVRAWRKLKREEQGK